jgi:N-acetyl-1-D-myo-inositol-2-amino-2-deoxy-alpha-D-glucopyranoside deacetylase
MQGSRGLASSVAAALFAVLVGGIAGVITTFTHRQLAPWSLIAGLAVAVAVVLGFRLVFESRAVGAAAGVGFLLGTGLVALPGAGAPVFALDGPLDWIWAIAPAVLIVAAVAPPWPGGAPPRP